MGFVHRSPVPPYVWPLALQMAKLSVHDSHIDKEDGIIRISAPAYTFMRNRSAFARQMEIGRDGDRLGNFRKPELPVDRN